MKESLARFTGVLILALVAAGVVWSYWPESPVVRITNNTGHVVDARVNNAAGESFPAGRIGISEEALVSISRRETQIWVVTQHFDGELQESERLYTSGSGSYVATVNGDSIEFSFEP